MAGETTRKTPYTTRLPGPVLDKLRAIAYWDRTTVADLVENAIADLIKSKEAQNGPYKPKPEKTG